MKRSIDTTRTATVRPRVTPDPQDAATLARRFSELSYVPENGFHRDQQQPRKRKERP